MIPTSKAPQIEVLLETMFGRTTAITNDLCVQPPTGCGANIYDKWFRDEESKQEYRTSGLCQECQDVLFGYPTNSQGDC